MSVNLSVKNVPDDLADRLRTRAARNRRSLQGELMAILDAAVGHEGTRTPSGPVPLPGRLSIDDLVARAAELLSNGTPSSVDLIRQMRDQWAAQGSQAQAPPKRKRK